MRFKPLQALTISVCMTMFATSATGQDSRIPPMKHTYQHAKTGGQYMHNFYIPPPGTGSPWSPEWMPDGERIVFSYQGSIWVVDADGGPATELVTSEAYLSSPAPSPDGSSIVYIADDGIGVNLEMYNLKTGATTAITEGESVNLDPAYSPDGSRLAYVTTEPNGHFNIVVREMSTQTDRDREGESESSLTRLTSDNSFGRPRLYFGQWDVHIEPTWSPEGDEVLFLSNRGIALGSGAVWRMPVEENAIEKATVVRMEETLYRTRPDWAPDGKRFIYSSHLGDQFNHLYVLPVAGGEPYKITFGEWDDFHPRWSPDGQRIAYISNKGGSPQLWVMETVGGRQTQVQPTEWRWKNPSGVVQVEVRDLESKEILGARIYNEASDGKAYVPHDAYHRLGRIPDHVFHTDGTFTMTVPAGTLQLEAVHGFEYLPSKVAVSVVADDTTRLTIDLERMIDLQAQGWYSGSNHVHMNYAGNLRNTPENLVFMANAEHVHVIGEMVANKDNRVIDYQYFTGEQHPLSDENHVLYFNQEYRPPFHGHISMINLTEHLMSPATTGYEGTAIESLYPTNTDIFRLAREQGALGAYVHPYFGDGDPLEGNLGSSKAFPVDVALGTVDYHEVLTYPSRAAMMVWHHVLNNDFRITGVGGEDSISDLHKWALLGQMRSYAYMPRGLSWDGWLEAIRSGKMTVTNGPLLDLTVNGMSLGSEIQLEEPGEVDVSGSVHSIVPLDSVQIIVKGRVVESVPIESEMGKTRIEFHLKIPVEESSWITLQAFGNGVTHPINDIRPFATTNPIWVVVDGKPVRSKASAEYFVRWIDKLIDMAEEHPGWRTEDERYHVINQFEEARAVYRKLESEK